VTAPSDAAASTVRAMSSQRSSMQAAYSASCSPAACAGAGHLKVVVEAGVVVAVVASNVALVAFVAFSGSLTHASSWPKPAVVEEVARGLVLVVVVVVLLVVVVAAATAAVVVVVVVVEVVVVVVAVWLI